MADEPKTSTEVLAYQIGELYKVVCDPSNPHNLQTQVTELKNAQAKIAGAAMALSGAVSFVGTFWGKLFGGSHNG